MWRLFGYKGDKFRTFVEKITDKYRKKTIDFRCPLGIQPTKKMKNPVAWHTFSDFDKKKTYKSLKLCNPVAFLTYKTDYRINPSREEKRA